MLAIENNLQYVQGTQEWLDLRKTKVTATDAAVIMGVSAWTCNTKLKLYNEKKSPENKTFMNAAMKRGIDLEPFARTLFTLKTGIEVEPKVIVNDWAMASVDGISECGKYLVEIKCPGDDVHSISLEGKVPEYYYPQLQHQLWICDLEEMYYFSFNGADGVLILVKRDNDYIEKMIAEEFKFYMHLQESIPPDLEERDYVIRDEEEAWRKCASELKEITQQRKLLEDQEASLTKQLIFLSGESNSKGAGISLCQIQRKGNIDYAKIPELKGINLEKYRKSASSYWRVIQNG